MVGCAKRKQYDLIKFVYLIPIYWLAMSVAAWQGLVQLIIKPHYWPKTRHGLHLKPTATPVSAVRYQNDIAQQVVPPNYRIKIRTKDKYDSDCF
jgi:hypothetical protein